MRCRASRARCNAWTLSADTPYVLEERIRNRVQTVHQKRIMATTDTCGPMQASKVGASELAASILGPWGRAPKAGRDAYERYLAAVSALLGGEASSQEVQAAAAAAWPTLQRLPSPEQLQGRGSAAAMEPIR